MLNRIARKSRLPVARAGFAAFLWFSAPAYSQAPAPLAPAQFDPSDVYFQGYLSTRSADQLEASGDFVGAAEKLKKAREMFEAVSHYYPDWKPEMVTGRSKINSEAEIRVHPKAEEQRRKNQNAVAELEGGVKSSGTFIDPAEGVVPLAPSILEADPVATRNLAAAEAEVKRLHDLAKNSVTPDADPARNESRIRDMGRQRDAMQAQLNAAEKNLELLRSKLAAKPVENETKQLDQRIADLEQDHEAMRMALKQSRSEHTEALAKIATLTADLEVMQQKYSDLDRNIKTERGVANEVVKGQRTQLQALEKQLAKKDEALGKANETIASLKKQLDESDAAFDQIRTERDSLLQERDQMKALLNLNADSRIQDLIQQNMGLAKNLREATEKVEMLNRDNNSSKDELNEAKRDLSMTKAQINRLHQEKRDQDERLAEMEKRLKGEEAALSNGQASADPAEVTMLRDIIQRQLRVQERRRQARDLLVEAVRDMGTKDERLDQAIKLFDSQEIALSPEEQSIVDASPVDVTLRSLVTQDKATVDKNTSALNRDIAVYERTAEKTFAAGRYAPTRELFQMIIEQHPGHVSALCKLGVVDLKMNDPAAAVDTFRRAVELKSDNPYAHRMLGLSFMTMGDFRSAEQSTKEAVALSPDDALSLALLGAISENLAKPGEAEAYYKAAISADPMPSEPYFNLARLCAKNKRYDIAREYYQKALERGAVPDPKLEQRLQK
ncbi:tetratricopeptide repeat protein [Luteolibacter sp.]|uniref:tetratricopeptide repeat protein n=1 Tax=Luteolibacter sp. TaxID=1962973 RepID=UPI003264D273